MPRILVEGETQRISIYPATYSDRKPAIRRTLERAVALWFDS
jgi:hypothetical protein